MPAYVVVQIEVEDPVRYAEYRRIAPPTIAAYGGRYVVRGNHDRHAGDPPADLKINCVDAPAFLPPFVLRHQPAAAEQGYTLAGHVHPGIVLAGPGLFRERLPCFVIGESVAVLPAFGSFTGLGMITPEPGERVFVVAESEVVPVG